jgi:hypothetical protein
MQAAKEDFTDTSLVQRTTGERGTLIVSNRPWTTMKGDGFGRARA